MAASTGPNLVTSGLAFNIDSFKYNSLSLGEKIWTTNDGNNRIGNITSSITFNTSLGVVAFDGSASIDYGNFLPVLTNSDITVEAWVYPTATGGQKCILSQSTNSGSWQFNLSYSFSGTWRWETPGGSLQDAATYPINNWYHVVGRVVSGVSTIWVNGVQTTSGSGALSSSATTHTFQIAKFNGALTSFIGNIQAVRIYTRALSDLEIQQNYRAFYGRTFEPVSFPALTTTLAIASKSIVVNVAETGFIPVTSSGGYNKVVWTVGPTLPTGLALFPGTGSISGIPTSLLFSTAYTLIATDAIGQVSSKTFSFAVNPVVLTTTLDSATVSTFPNVTQNVKPVSAAGGFGTLSYSISPSLPSGLNLNTASGFITGSYNTTINQSYTVTVTDQATPTPQTSNKAFTLAIITPPALLTTLVQASYSFGNGAQISATQPVVASGGVPPYTYAVNTVLPAGILFNTTTGVISGTPTAGLASTSFTVTATDASLQTSAKSFSITVSSYAAAISTTNLYAHWDFALTTDAVNTSYTTNGTAFSGGISGSSFGAVSSTPSMTYNAGSTSHPMTVQQTASGRKYVRFSTLSPTTTYPTQGLGSRLQSGGNAWPNITGLSIGYTLFAAFRIRSPQNTWNRPHRLRLEGFNFDFNGLIFFWNSSGTPNDLNYVNYTNASLNANPSFGGVTRAISTTTDVYTECVSVIGTTVRVTFWNGTTYTFYTGAINTPAYGTVADANRTYEIRDNFYWNGGPALDYFEGGVYSVALTQAEQLAVCTGLRDKWTT